MLSLAVALSHACSSGVAVPIADDFDAAPDLDASTPDAGSDEYLLSQTGLYDDIGAQLFSATALEYEPAYPLWSDGAVKGRWLILPPGELVDTSDMDRWQVPVGTKLFKEFLVEGRRIETRLIERTGPGDDDYFMGAFLWQEDGLDAVYVQEGQRNALGTNHDVPRAVKCWECHAGEPGRIIGFSAMQLSHQGAGLTLDSLVQSQLLSQPPAPGTTYPVPGNPTTAAAIGYLHANCGHCHNEQGPAYADVDMVLRLDVAEIDPATSRLLLSTLSVDLEKWAVEPYQVRIDPGVPALSAVLARMGRRGGLDQMPPLGTEVVDDDALAIVEAWIQSLTP